MTVASPKPKDRVPFVVFFWLFNLLLLLILGVIFITPFGRAVIGDAMRGIVPLSILIPVAGLVGVPTTSSVMGRRRAPRNAPRNANKLDPETAAKPARPLTLFQIFYGLEAPLLTACLIRLCFLRDLTPVNAVIFTSIALGTFAFGHWLLRHRYPDATSTGVHLAGATLMLALSLYLCGITLFYVPPLLVFTGTVLYQSPDAVMVIAVLLPFIVVVAGLVTAPWGMVLLFSRSWGQILKQRSEQRGDRWSWGLVGGGLALWLAVLVLLGQQQPQAKAFALLESQPRSAGDRQALLQKSEVIRSGLLNAYLSAYRYPLIENTHIHDIYSDYMGYSEAIADAIQGAYNTLLTPFVYRGTAADQDKAAQLYAEFFDTPILRGEHEAIQKAVLSNFNRTQAKAGLLDIGAERVRLQRQEITVTPEGDWAEVELHEIYANTTLDNTEILYYFSLPESATVTGLWLGETGDRAQRYTHVVATRGAAQQVYNDQVQRRVDPALLEQVGPRNYRLRAFPIPPMGQDRLPEDGKEDRMHLWMTYKVMQQDGQWPLPALSEQRNIFWDRSTQRVVNGKRQRGSNGWLPASVLAEPVTAEPVAVEPVAAKPISTAPKSQAQMNARQPVQVALPAGYLVANPLEADDYQLPQGKRFAVVLDGSYSMGEHRSEVEASIQWLKDHLLASNAADIYVTQAGGAQAKKVDAADFDPNQAVFYGALQTRQMLEQYRLAAEASGYDAILLLTDAGSYELTEDSTPLPLAAPLWMVHLGGFQAAYDDATLETIQSTGGNVAADLETAMPRIATQPSLGERTSLLNVADGYAWFLSRAPYPGAATDPTLAPIAARQWVAQVSQAVKPDQLNQLDAIHQVAKENSIVTPYSSMLVLVNSEQRRQLKEAEGRRDRFDREVEDQQLPDPQTSTVSAVPEPGEWLLLGVCLAVLGGWYWWSAARAARSLYAHR